MSLIHTCELNKANPFDYLTELQKHSEELKQKPSEWMPWNYRAVLAAISERHRTMAGVDPFRPGPIVLRSSGRAGRASVAFFQGKSDNVLASHGNQLWLRLRVAEGTK